MRIINPIQINDWGIRRFLSVVLTIQLLLWGLLGLEALGLPIPVIRQIVSFIYLLYIPGILIIRILKLHRLGTIETLLYSVGLSIATIMFTGAVINTVYPPMGISSPISLISLTITMSAIIPILSVIAYCRDKDFSDLDNISVSGLFSPQVLFLLLLPFISIIGTILVNSYHNNIILMVLIAVIAVVVILVGFNKLIPKNLYPLAVFVIGLSLLFHRSLISMYITGFDIHHEYYLTNLVITNGSWDPTIPIGYNAMLSVTMLAPVNSIISGMNLTWVFKIIYPLVFALVPLVLYRIFQKQTDDRIAFFAIFFYMIIPQFFYDMPTLLRQQIATLFLVSLVMLMIDKNMMKTQKLLLFIVFSALLVVSHYGLSYLFMVCLIFAWLILTIVGNPRVQKLINALYLKLSSLGNKKLVDNIVSPNVERRTISLFLVFLFVIVTSGWYILLSQSVIFHMLVDMSGDIVSGTLAGLLRTETSEGLKMLLTKPAPGLLHLVHAAMNYLNQVFIVFGVLVLFTKRGKWTFSREYTTLSVINLGILFASVIVPFFNITFNLMRLYHITLIFLSPFCIIGGISILNIVSRPVRALWNTERITRLLKVSVFSIISIYLSVFFLYQTGFVSELTQEIGSSVALNQESIKRYSDDEGKVTLYSAVTPEQDVLSAEWLSLNRESQDLIYATYSDIRVHSLLSYGMIPIANVPPLSKNTQAIPEHAYVYLQYLNVVEGIGTEIRITPLRKVEKITYDINEVSHLYEAKNKIYTNGGSEVYR
ncbi:DUF2206 domain-containing protein [Chloroflexota bacterium]